MLSQKANVLTKSVGEEVGLKDSYSKNTYVGIVRKVTAKCVVLEDENQKEVNLKISNVDILSESEVFQWKRSNLKLEHFSLSVQLPSKCDEKYLIKMFENIEPVIDVELSDIKQYDDQFSNFTFNYRVFNKKDKIYVEEYVGGIGGKII